MFGLAPETIAVIDGDVFVGGATADGSGPALDRIGGALSAVPIRLAPSEPYARTGRLTSIAGDGTRLYLIGVRTGGAHDNPRWTVWDGPEGGPVTSRPQEFFTFGGHDAGPLLATVVVDGSPVVVGSRGGQHGSDAAIYTRSGTTWTAAADVDQRARSRASAVLGFGAVTAHASRILIAGDAVDTTDGIRQAPVLFIGRVGGPWQMVVLPVPPSTARGHLSRATSVSCADDVCWVAGWSGGRPMAWSVAVTDEPVSVVLDAHILPGEEPTGTDPVAVVTVAGGVPVVFPNAREPGTVVGCPDGWRTGGSPAEPVTAAAAAGQTLYAISGHPGRISAAALAGC